MKTDRQEQNKPDASRTGRTWKDRSGTVSTIRSILGNGNPEELKKVINEKGGYKITWL